MGMEAGKKLGPRKGPPPYTSPRCTIGRRCAMQQNADCQRNTDQETSGLHRMDPAENLSRSVLTGSFKDLLTSITGTASSKWIV